jgi:Putative zinc-finger
MCEFSSKLIAWLDNELPEAETAAMDHHITLCRECREQADAFREVSHAFAVYAKAVPPWPARSANPWLLVPSAIAAAVLAVLLLWPGRLPNAKPVIQRSADAQPPHPVNVPRKAAQAIATVLRPRVPKRVRAQAAAWQPAERTIQIIIPADALFPPGAFPEGVGFVADLRLASDGSASGLALRP